MGGNELSFEISRTAPPAHLFPSVQGETTCRRNSVAPCASLPLPPLKRKKSFCISREVPGAHPAPSQSPSIHSANRQSGRRGDGDGVRTQLVATELQRRYCEQDIPKQLEEADIWCCTLVLGPPQNGPVLSGNLVIFSASLARLQIWVFVGGAATWPRISNFLRGVQRERCM